MLRLQDDQSSLNSFLAILEHTGLSSRKHREPQAHLSSFYQGRSTSHNITSSVSNSWESRLKSSANHPLFFLSFVTHKFTVSKSVYMTVCQRNNLLNNVQDQAPQGHKDWGEGETSLVCFSTRWPSVFCVSFTTSRSGKLRCEKRQNAQSVCAECVCLCVCAWGTPSTHSKVQISRL